MKKLINKVTKITAVIFSAVLITSIWIGNARADTTSVCKITVNLDDANQERGVDLSLRMVENYFNEEDRDEQYCKRKWTFDVAHINLKHQVRITGYPSEHLTITTSGGRVLLDGSNVDEDCTIFINTDNVTIENINLQQGGICVGSEANNITFKNMKIASSPGNAITVREGSSNIRIDSGVVIDKPDENGIVFERSMVQGDEIYYAFDGDQPASGSVSFTGITEADDTRPIITGKIPNCGGERKYLVIDAEPAVSPDQQILGRALCCDEQFPEDFTECSGATIDSVLLYTLNLSTSDGGDSEAPCHAHNNLEFNLAMQDWYKEIKRDAGTAPYYPWMTGIKTPNELGFPEVPRISTTESLDAAKQKVEAYMVAVENVLENEYNYDLSQEEYMHQSGLPGGGICEYSFRDGCYDTLYPLKATSITDLIDRLSDLVSQIEYIYPQSIARKKGTLGFDRDIQSEYFNRDDKPQVEDYCDGSSSDFSGDESGTTLFAKIDETNGLEVDGSFEFKADDIFTEGENLDYFLVPVYEKTERKTTFGISTKVRSDKWQLSGGAGGGGGTGGGTGDRYFGRGYAVGFKNTADCLRFKRGLSISMLVWVDSDGDGVPDIAEDLNGDCRWDKGKETDWRYPDTDKDGISDGDELGGDGYINCYSTEFVEGLTERDAVNVPNFSSGEQVVAYPVIVELNQEALDNRDNIARCGEIDGTLLDPNDPDDNSCTLNGNSAKKFTYYPAKLFELVDRIGLRDNMAAEVFISSKELFCIDTNPLSPDSDADNIDDGEEDRSSAFDSRAKYYYKHPYDSGWLRDENGERIECYNPLEQGVEDESHPIGKFYERHDVPIDVPYKGDNGDVVIREELRNMFTPCVSDSLGSTDMDGNVDIGNGETNPFNPDSDGDGYCDGNGGRGCETLDPGLPDLCPTRGDGHDRGCEPRCVDGAIFVDVPYGKKNEIIAAVEKVNSYQDIEGPILDENGESLKTEDGKVITWSSLNDSDQDDIPDIVENPTGKCIGSYTSSRRYLNPYSQDTDGDGVDDKHDFCPWQKSIDEDGEVDPFPCYCERKPNSDEKVDPTCRDQLVDYTNKKAIYNFMDWDDDLLMNAEEDPNYDGNYEFQVTITRNGETVTVIETDPHLADSDFDGLSDLHELRNMTNTHAGKTHPRLEDTDSDGISDGDEVQFGGSNKIYDIMEAAFDTTQVCPTEYRRDTDPTVYDTDGDGLSDGLEIYYMHTDPNDADTDNDGLCDGKDAVEGVCEDGELRNIPVFREGQTSDDFSPDSLETDPCNSDTDGDGYHDGEDSSPLTPDETNAYDVVNECGRDSDGDGLPDVIEDQIGTEKDGVGSRDTDGDGLEDGCVIGPDGTPRGELCNAARDCYASLGTHTTCEYGGDYKDCDTDPLKADTDNDFLEDLEERKYGTNPRIQDTDGDCILDGIEDANQDGQWTSGETRAASEMSIRIVNGQEIEDMWDAIDTDGDGLTDGVHTRYSMLGYEDRDCNGFVNVDEEGRPETDPRVVDTDGDGVSDRDEFFHGGRGFDINNADFASSYGTQGQGFCSMIPGASPDITVMILFALMSLAGIAIRRRMVLSAVEKK